MFIFCAIRYTESIDSLDKSFINLVKIFLLLAIININLHFKWVFYVNYDQDHVFIKRIAAQVAITLPQKYLED